MATHMPDPADAPLSWLWAEIARRFGAAQAAELMLEFETQRLAGQPRRSRGQGELELPVLEERLRVLEESGEPETAYMRDLRWKIDLHRQMQSDRSSLSA